MFNTGLRSLGSLGGLPGRFVLRAPGLVLLRLNLFHQHICLLHGLIVQSRTGTAGVGSSFLRPVHGHIYYDWVVLNWTGPSCWVVPGLHLFFCSFFSASNLAPRLSISNDCLITVFVSRTNRITRFHHSAVKKNSRRLHMCHMGDYCTVSLLPAECLGLLWPAVVDLASPAGSCVRSHGVLSSTFDPLVSVLGIKASWISSLQLFGHRRLLFLSQTAILGHTLPPL